MVGHRGTFCRGRCIFCGACAELCPDAINFHTGEYRMGAFSPEALQIPGTEPWQESANKELRKLCGKSLKIRQVSAGGYYIQLLQSHHVYLKNIILIHL